MGQDSTLVRIKVAEKARLEAIQAAAEQVGESLSISDVITQAVNETEHLFIQWYGPLVYGDDNDH